MADSTYCGWKCSFITRYLACDTDICPPQRDLRMQCFIYLFILPPKGMPECVFKLSYSVTFGLPNTNKMCIYSVPSNSRILMLLGQLERMNGEAMMRDVETNVLFHSHKAAQTSVPTHSTSNKPKLNPSMETQQQNKSPLLLHQNSSPALLWEKSPNQVS